MPQFELANFLPQFVWLAIAFALLYFVVVGPLLPRVGRVVDQREAMIKGDIATAEAAKLEADRVRDRHEQAMAEARGQAQVAVAEAQARMQRTAEVRLAEAHQVTETRLGHATAALAAARARAVDEVARIATDAAIEIVERVTGRRPEESAAAAAVVQGNA